MSGRGDAPERACLALLAAREQTLACAESCTGGLIAKRVTDVPGASRVFLGGVVSYTNSVKAGVLGVPEAVLARFGAVSRETALAMAEGARRLLKADFALSSTGVCGPASDERGTPVGTGFVALATPAGSVCRAIRMPGGRSKARAYAAAQAFDLLLRHVEGTLEENERQTD